MSLIFSMERTEWKDPRLEGSHSLLSSRCLRRSAGRRRLSRKPFRASRSGSSFPTRQARPMTSWRGCWQLQAKLGQPVVIDNKPGGGTTIGTMAAAVAPPDGYTLLFASSALVIEPILTKQVEYDPQKDFTPVAFIARTSLLLTIS